VVVPLGPPGVARSQLLPSATERQGTASTLLRVEFPLLLLPPGSRQGYLAQVSANFTSEQVVGRQLASSE
jgi:hypothetical protein